MVAMKNCLGLLCYVNRHVGMCNITAQWLEVVMYETKICINYPLASSTIMVPCSLV